MKTEEVIVGTKVNYYSVITDDGSKLGKKSTEIMSEPWILGSGEIVCKVKGIVGGVSIKHLELIETELTPKLNSYISNSNYSFTSSS